MNRIRGLKKIKSVEEYNRLKDELKAEVDEYVAFVYFCFQLIF